MPTPLNKTTIGLQVAGELRRRILAGEFAVGAKLQQEQIAADLGVSRSPVREALNQLEAEGLVILVPQRGAQVSPLDADEIAEHFELRLLLEPFLLGKAIPAMGEEDFAAAEAIIAEMVETDAAAWAAANWRRHEALYRPSNRPLMLKTLRRTHEAIGRYLRMQLVVTRSRDSARDEHRAIVERCRLRDVEGAQALLREHIAAAMNLVPGADISR